jgi:hypothetical protein
MSLRALSKRVEQARADSRQSEEPHGKLLFTVVQNQWLSLRSAKEELQSRLVVSAATSQQAAAIQVCSGGGESTLSQAQPL